MNSLYRCVLRDLLKYFCEKTYLGCYAMSLISVSFTAVPDNHICRIGMGFLAFKNNNKNIVILAAIGSLFAKLKGIGTPIRCALTLISLGTQFLNKNSPKTI